MNITVTRNYNFTMNKGWNELSFRVEKYTETTSGYSEEISITNNITSDLKWRFVTSDNLRSAEVGSFSKAHLPKTPLLFKSK